MMDKPLAIDESSIADYRVESFTSETAWQGRWKQPSAFFVIRGRQEEEDSGTTVLTFIEPAELTQGTAQIPG